jgi:hypothetical protein
VKQYNLFDRLGQLATEPFTHGPVLLWLTVGCAVVFVASTTVSIVMYRREAKGSDRDFS